VREKLDSELDGLVDHLTGEIYSRDVKAKIEGQLVEQKREREESGKNEPWISSSLHRRVPQPSTSSRLT